MSINYDGVRNLHFDGLRRDARRTFSPTDVTVRAMAAPSSPPRAILIEPRQLIRDCLANGIRATSDLEVIALPSVEEWVKISGHTRANIVLLSGFERKGRQELTESIRVLLGAKRRIPTIIFSDEEDIEHVVNMLNHDVEGFIPTNMSLNIAAEAMRLVRAGGVFVPVDYMKSGGGSTETDAGRNPLQEIFTARQIDIVEALRKGKANKTIAYELNLQESTVKVHIRNIMKKLRARNRTEVAFIVSNLQTQAAYKT
jgi:DNA-binding NarL/FixJ family response regulator